MQHPQVKQMKRKLLVLLAATLLAGCSNEEQDIDTEYPEIDLSFEDAFPVQCSEIMRGNSFTFKARFSDNVALGSYSIDIHHNFDHHTHSTETVACEMEEEKDPVNPLLLIETHQIPGGPMEYTATQEINVPDDVDPGDYHLMIKLTDREGWQTIRGISIKIL